MNTQAVHPEVAQYVAQVRAYLADLSPDEVEELTAGLEADLTDEREESEGGAAWRARVGEPATYAAELRAAGGLPPARPAPPSERNLDPFEQAVARWDAWAKPEWLQPLLEVARVFAPVGWVLRGAIAAFATVGLVGLISASLLLPGLVALVGLVALSIWLGLQVRQGHVWARVIGAVGNAFAVAVAAVVLFFMVQGATASADYSDMPVQDVSGLTIDGEPVTNLYAYDADGNRVERIRLFDQRGRALKVFTEQATADGGLESREETVFPVPNGGDPWKPALSEDGLEPWEPALRLTPLQLVSPSASPSAAPTPSPSTSPREDGRDSSGSRTTSPPTR